MDPHFLAAELRRETEQTSEFAESGCLNKLQVFQVKNHARNLSCDLDKGKQCGVIDNIPTIKSIVCFIHLFLMKCSIQLYDKASRSNKNTSTKCLGMELLNSLV